jgi:hypothetical protein
MTVTATDFDLLIGRDAHFLRIYAVCIAFVVAAGGVLAGVSVWSDLDFLLRVVAGCLTTIGGALPARQAWGHYSRIRWLRTLHQKWTQLTQSEEATPTDLNRLEKLIWDAYKL